MTQLNVTYVPATFKTLGGGLNSTSGSLNVDDAESSDLLNVDFNKFGSVLKRNGYTILNTSVLSDASQGLHWYQGLYGEYLVTVNKGKVYKMDNLDGVWDDVSGAVSLGGSQDSYTKLMLKMDGSDQGTTFTDSSSSVKTVSSLESYDAYTYMMLHCNGSDNGTTFTDSLGLTVTNVESYDSYTVLMLHAEGTDGDGFTTDSSLSVHVVSTVTDAQIDTAQYKFGSSSILLTTSPGYLTIPDNANWSFGSSPFTIDLQSRWKTVGTTSIFFDHLNSADANDGMTFMYTANTLTALTRSNADYTLIFTTPFTPVVDTWYHLALVRVNNSNSSSGWRMFIDGVSQTLTKDSGDWNASVPESDGLLKIGRSTPFEGLHDGWIDEYRVSNGVARWTTNFTAPAYSYGQIRTSTSTKKFGTASARFGGGAGYLSLADSASWNVSISNFTVDLYANANSLAQDSTLFGQYQDTNNYLVSKLTSANTLTFSIKSNSTLVADYTASHTFNTSTFYHLAYVRNSTSFDMYIDGVKKSLTSTTSITTKTMPDLAAVFTIGQSGNSGYFDGNIDEFRFSKGISRWTANFTPWKVNYGLPYTVTDIKKLGSASAEIKDGASLYLVTSTDWSFSTSNFTVDFWVNFNNLTNAQVFTGQYKDGDEHWYLRKQSNANGNKLQMVFVNTTTQADYYMSANWGVNSNQWYHVAFQRTGTNGEIFIDGVRQTVSSTTSFGTNDVGMMTATNLNIGVSNHSSYLTGYLDELRISKGITRWSADFTPPTEGYGSFNRQDMETFLGYVLGCDTENVPWSWAAQNSTASNITVPTGVTGSKFIKKFQNYCFLGNVKINNISYNSRIHYSAIQDFNTWDDAEYIDISPDDGQEITGVKELADRLVIYKNHAIYVIIFTGDSDIPFIVQKTNSAVGCSSPWSIQANENGHIFASYDGVYFFDGVNSYKLSDRINETYAGINKEELDLATSVYQKEKNKYWLSLPSGTSLYNNLVLTWDSFLNAWSKYDGMSCTTMTLAMVGNTDERPYFGDYNGYYYRLDNGMRDYPLNSATSINSYFYTNWKHFDTLCDKKGMPHVYIAHRNESRTILTFNYAYDFYNGDQYTHTFPANTTQSVTALTTRRDLVGRGRFIRIGIANNATDNSFRVDGIGTYLTREGMI